MIIGKYSFGTGDRFSQQGNAQLQAIINAKKAGLDITPVWNKSNREHQIIQSTPADTRAEADAAIKALGWDSSYFVDADHINLNTVDNFIDYSDFFTLDVADYIGEKAENAAIEAFIKSNSKYIGKLSIPGIDEPFDITEEMIRSIAERFLYAVDQAAQIYQKIAAKKGVDNFVTEVSMDEVNDPQTPVEMFFILSAIAEKNIPAQTIAPKFTGRFNKGVDYVGDIKQFAKEFKEDILVIDFAVKEFGLPENLKLSVHSGSDKFSIYPIMGEIIKKYDKGIHVKTAGTTWLEEIIGLALADGDGLELAKDIYAQAYKKKDALCEPYATVIDIKDENLPSPEEVNGWDSKKFAETLRHDQQNANYNADLRQLIHVGYKIAAEKGATYIDTLNKFEKIVGQQVTENIYDRHVKRLFNL